MPVLSDILAQPDSLAKVAHHQLGDGLPAIEQASKLIKGASHVVFSAIGASYNACIPVVNQLRSVGVSVQLLDAAEFLHNPGKIDRMNAVYILVSRSGESVEIIKLIKVLKQNKAKVIGVVNEAESNLVQNSDCSLIVNSPVDHSLAIQTFTGTLLTLYILFEILVEERDIIDIWEESHTFRNNLHEVVNRFSQLSLGWQNFLKTATVIYLLARGSSLTAAHEGALLFHELAKFPAIAMGSGTFRHGSVEVVDEQFRAITFTSPGISSTLDEALARNLADFGGQVRIIGDGNGSSAALQGLERWNVGVAHPMLTPVLEVIPVQFAAYRLAVRSGFTPGKFKFLSSVVEDETRFEKSEEK